MSNDLKLKKILIVDDEEDMIWSLQKNLQTESLPVEVLTAPSGEEALEVLAQNIISLVVTDIKMPGISGLDLLIEIKNRYPHTAVIIMTAFPSTEFKKEAILRGSLHFIEKPFDINQLRDIISHALENDNLFKGTVAGVSLADVIQIKCLSRVTSALRVKEANKLGIIYFQDGKIIHAICNDLEGEEAFYNILSFKGGELDSVQITDIPHRTIDIPVEALLMEWARRVDEGSGQDVDEGTALEELDLFNQAGEKSAENSGTADHAESGTNVIMEGEMAELKDVLTEFTNIPGVNTACLVGRDGFLLDSIAISGIDTEMIGAIASSGFGASESMGRQLEKGEMSMSMIEYSGGPVMMAPIGSEAFLVIVAEKEANLGMIRLKIKKHSQQIAETAAI